MLARDLIFGIDQPEYVGPQELYISELCNSISSVSGWDTKYPSENNSKLGLVFDDKGENIGKKVRILSTCPKSDEDVKKWETALKDSGLEVKPDQMKDAADAILKSLRGLKAVRQKRTLAVPLTPNVALLQDRFGSLGRGGPSDTAAIIEEMYCLGGKTVNSEPVDDSDTAIKQLEKAMRHRLETNWFLAVIDKAVSQGIFPGSIEKKDNKNNPTTTGFDGQTPYGWFRESWDLLTSNQWVDALPPRRWTDWATTLLRTVYGFGLLWEMRWHEEIAKKIMSTEESTDIEKSDLIELTNSECTLKWADSMLGVSNRDVSSSLKRRITRGIYIRTVVKEMLKNKPENTYASEFFNSAEEENIEAIKKSLSEQRRGGAIKNRWEATKYALSTRDESAYSLPDYYGLLRPIGKRYLIVDPSTEWIAVIASLAIGDPGSTGTLGDVQKVLMKLGLQPTIQELTRRLEWAGLARSTPDADIGVNVESAF